MAEIELKSIPRVESSAPNKNTVEWKIPNEVSVALMIIQRVGFTFVAKVKVKKKHWWKSSHKSFSTSSPNPFEAVTEISDFLEKHGYYIDHNTIQFGETVGL